MVAWSQVYCFKFIGAFGLPGCLCWSVLFGALFDLVRILYTVPSILSIGIFYKCTQYILYIFILGTVLIIFDTHVIINYKFSRGDYMPYSEAQKKAVKKYNEKNYDELKVRVKKGNKDIIQKHADLNNETVNGMINRLLENEIPDLKE